MTQPRHFYGMKIGPPVWDMTFFELSTLPLRKQNAVLFFRDKFIPISAGSCFDVFPINYITGWNKTP